MEMKFPLQQRKKIKHNPTDKRKVAWIQVTFLVFMPIKIQIYCRWQFFLKYCILGC